LKIRILTPNPKNLGMSEMASDEEENIIPFQLQFDKPIPFQVLVLLLLKVRVFFMLLRI